MSQSRQLAAIMFTDIVGYTALMGKDEDKAFSLLQANRKIQRPLIEKFNGKWVKELGDGVLAQFNSAYDAVQCAIEIQKAARHNFDGLLRIGIHLGDITFENDDAFGDGVNLASRIQGIADPGGIYISASIENAIRNQSDIEVKYLGEAVLKNVSYPVKVFAIQGEGFPVPVFKKRPRFSKRTRIMSLLVVMFLLIISAWFLITKYSETDNALSLIKSIVVLPVSNLSGSTDQDYIAAGIQDAIITELSHINSLRVISRTTASKYANSDKTAPQIAEELKVDAVLETTMMLENDSIRLNVQFIGVSPKEEHIWADFFDSNIQNLLTMVSDVTKRIAKSIEIVLTPEEENLMVTKEIEDPELYKLYLRGKYHIEQYTPEGFEKGLQFLNEVIEKDPANALAYATLSIGYGDLAHLPSAPQYAFPRAKALAIRAVELDSTLVQAHTAIAESNLYYDWNFKNAENSFKAALAIDSNFAPAVSNYGWFLDLIGRKDEAERYLRKAADLDPLAPIYRSWLGWWYWGENRNEEAVVELKRVLEFSPNFPVANFVLGSVYADMKMFDEAIAFNKKAVAVNPTLNWALCRAYYLSGNKEEAMAILNSMKKTPFNAFSLVLIYSMMGDVENAIKWVQIVYDIRHMFTPWMGTLFAATLQDDPRFKKIMQPITDSLSVYNK